ncbi:LCP family protein [Rothia nasimurium]|uniref:LCP family protein n=1 Tax=Rothia nasimurium TaxID=85336 RepID=UPI001F2D24AE|nr:LCP family protein [Rothia nasimurium]
MSVEAHEEPKKKKSKKALWITLLILLLIPIIAVGGYLFMINKAWNKSETFDNAMPNEDGSVSSPHSDELQALVDSAKIVNDSGKDNITEGDANGNGILDIYEGGAVTARPVNTAATDILLLGSDQRTGAEALHVSGARADTIMVLHIPEDGSAAYLISIMRDTWVNIPGYGSHKVNAGLNYGGIDLQVATIEQLLGIQMDHVAEIDFQGFKALVDTLGGVTVDVPLSFSTGNNTFIAGPQTLNGSQALEFVRERYSFSDGDYQRVRNQRAFLRGVYNKLRADGALSSASKLLQVIESVSPYMSVDQGLSPSAIVGIAQPVLSNGNTQLVSMTLSNAGTGWSWDGQSIVVLDAAATSALSYALQTDTMPSYIATYGSD